MLQGVAVGDGRGAWVSGGARAAVPAPLHLLTRRSFTPPALPAPPAPPPLATLQAGAAGARAAAGPDGSDSQAAGQEPEPGGGQLVHLPGGCPAARACCCCRDAWAARPASHTCRRRGCRRRCGCPLKPRLPVPASRCRAPSPSLAPRTCGRPRRTWGRWAGGSGGHTAGRPLTGLALPGWRKRSYRAGSRPRCILAPDAPLLLPPAAVPPATVAQRGRGAGAERGGRPRAAGHAAEYFPDQVRAEARALLNDSHLP